MELMDLYYKIKNPIEDDKDLYRVLKAYSNYNGLYSGLTTASNRDYSEYKKDFGSFLGKYNEEDKDEFYSKVTNYWIKNIKNITSDDLSYYTDSAQEAISVLKDEYINRIGYCRSKEEVDYVLSGKNESEEIQDALDMFTWQYKGKKSSWEHVMNRKISCYRKDAPEVGHRLYVNPDSMDLYKFMNYFITKCQEQDLNYYFKFSKTYMRDDNFVIYSSTDELEDYINILKSIEKEHPDLVSRFKEPPILTGKVNDWIGYGSEPVEMNEDEITYSFNSLREGKILDPAIEEVTKDWILENMDKTIVYKNQEMTFKNLISHLVVDDIVDTLKYNIHNMNIIEAVKKHGICEHDLNSKKVLDDIYRIVNNKMEKNLFTYCTKSIDDVDSITLTLRDKKQFKFYSFAFDRVMRDVPRRIFKNDDSYRAKLRDQIEKNSIEYGVDIDKFCVDTYAYKEFLVHDVKNKNKEKSNKDLNDMFKSNQTVMVNSNVIQ